MIKRSSNNQNSYSYVIIIPTIADMPMVPGCSGRSDCRKEQPLIRNINKLRTPVAQTFNETMVTAR